MLSEMTRLNKKYSTDLEDILFIMLSRMGVSIDVEYARVRFVIEVDKIIIPPQEGTRRFFLALPVNKTSPFQIDLLAGEMRINGVRIGEVFDVLNDTCDSHYTRNNGTVINLNPVSKSRCHGCKFCHTIVQQAKDTKENLLSCNELNAYFQGFIEEQRKEDLSHIVQIAIVTGAFESEQKLVDYIHIVQDTAEKYGFRGEILYFGAELTSESLWQFSDFTVPLAYCYTLECFTNREKMLKPQKASKTINDIIELFQAAGEARVTTTYSYVLGLEPLPDMVEGFLKMRPYHTRFPIINVYQEHKNMRGDLLCKDAKEMDFFLDARKKIEDIFGSTPLRPRTWENYRSLWYVSFADEPLEGNRLP